MAVKYNEEPIRIGDRVRILEDVDMGWITFLNGHEFKVVSSDPIRGFDLQDDEGRNLRETRFVKMEKVC